MNTYEKEKVKLQLSVNPSAFHSKEKQTIISQNDNLHLTNLSLERKDQLGNNYQNKSKYDDRGYRENMSKKNKEDS